MIESTAADNSELESWLKQILSKENIKDLCVNILGNSEKGDGYLGDVIFVFVAATTNDGLSKGYNLVLKRSKRSQALREKSPVKQAFINEIFVYDAVLPAFTQFQRAKGIEDFFNSQPKCYGTLTADNLELLVLENMKKIGYDLWDRKKPLTRKHVDMVINEYGKLHAISVAMNDQQPKIFNGLVNGLYDTFKKFIEISNIETLFGSNIDELCDLLKSDLDEHVLLKWKNFKQQIKFVFYDMLDDFNGLKVILHRDGWSNNFMFQYEGKDKSLPSRVAVLDWQLSTFLSPIIDLSYFIFCCISKEDIEDLDVILETYYKSFSSYLTRLGSDSDVLYPFNQFLDDWKKLSKYGILTSTLLIKLCLTDKDEAPDMTRTAESDEDFANAFSFELKDKKILKNRMSHIVRYVVEHGLI